MRICTIGFSGKSADVFFETLATAGVQRVIDIRRSNNTLFASFTRLRDLPYFLDRLIGVEYVHEPEFAPSLELLREYQARLKANKKDAMAWDDLATRYNAEIAERPIWELFVKHTRGCATVCLLCMEPTPEKCHRRLLVEHLLALGGGELEIVHL